MGNEELLLDEENVLPYELSMDGRFLTYLSAKQETLGDLYLLSLSGDRHTQPLVRSPLTPSFRGVPAA